MIDYSKEATYKDSNGDVVSAFQRDQTLIRVIAKHDFGPRHVESVAVMSKVTWGAYRSDQGTEGRAMSRWARKLQVLRKTAGGAGAAAALLTGCAGAPQAITQTKTVEVPVAVPCKVRAVERPAWALDQVDPGADIYTKGRAALVEVKQRVAYEIRMEAAVAACQ